MNWLEIRSPYGVSNATSEDILLIKYFIFIINVTRRYTFLSCYWINILIEIDYSVYMRHRSHEMTKLTKCMLAKRRLRSGWTCTQSNQCPCCALSGYLRSNLSSYRQRWLRLDRDEVLANLILLVMHSHIDCFLMNWLQGVHEVSPCRITCLFKGLTLSLLLLVLLVITGSMW